MNYQSYEKAMKYRSNWQRSIAGLISIGLIACLVVGVSTGQAQAPPLRQYTVTDLGVLPAKKDRVSVPAGINDQGQVTGTSGMSMVDEAAFLSDPKNNKEGMQDLGRNMVGVCRGFAINGVGDVVGDATFGEAFSHAALFRNGKIADLGTLKGGILSRATGINASGQVVGYSALKPENNSTNRAFVWGWATGMFDIGTLGGEAAQAFGINDLGFVTGTSQIAETSRVEITHAFICQPFSMSGRSIKKMVDLGTLGGNDSYGMAINVNNHVVGYSTVKLGDDRIVHAFLYNGRKMLDLGSLDSWMGDDQSYALGLNQRDEVVGYSYAMAIAGDVTHPVRQVGFIYRQGEMLNLNNLIGKASENYLIRAATGINNSGQIVAIAEELGTGETHAVLLTQ